MQEIRYDHTQPWYSASVATIARVIYTSQVSLAEFFYTVNVPFLWGGIELATSIFGTSAATLKPLLLKLKIFKGSSYGPQSGGYELGSDQGMSNTRTKVTIGGSEKPQKVGRTNSSTEEITWDGKGGSAGDIQGTMYFETSTGGSNSEWVD